MIIPFGGTYLFLEFEKVKAKKYASAVLATEGYKPQMLWLKFTQQQLENEIHWEEKNEFEYNGQMYDVAEKETNGDTTHFYVYWDRLETMVNKKLNQLIALSLGESEENDKDARLIVSLYKAQYLSPSNAHIVFSHNLIKKYFYPSLQRYNSNHPGLETPPPRSLT